MPSKDRYAAYRKQHPERLKARNSKYNAKKAAKRYNITWRYGITPAEYDAILAAQGYCCAICGTDAPGGKGWHTDHDHSGGKVRGKVRGILCGRCNMALGLLDDDPERFRLAAAYLEKTKLWR